MRCNKPWLLFVSHQFRSENETQSKKIFLISCLESIKISKEDGTFPPAKWAMSRDELFDGMLPDKPHQHGPGPGLLNPVPVKMGQHWALVN